MQPYSVPAYQFWTLLLASLTAEINVGYDPSPTAVTVTRRKNVWDRAIDVLDGWRIHAVQYHTNPTAVSKLQYAGLWNALWADILNQLQLPVSSNQNVVDMKAKAWQVARALIERYSVMLMMV